MTAKRRTGELFSTRWVHVFEEDTSEGAVYRPDDEKVPLSRKPRGWLEFHEDGSATGPDDRPVERATTGQDAGHPRRTRDANPAELEIVDRSPSRVVVKRQP